MTMSLADLRGLPHLSVSRIKTFLQCPKKHALQYVEKVEPAFRPIALAFGTAFHEAIGCWLLDAVPAEAIYSVFRDSLTEAANADGAPLLFDDDEADLGSTIDAGVRMLDAFIANVPRPPKVLGVEVPFAIELAHPVTGEVAPVPLIGAIDAVIDDGDARIWELKTGKKRWTADQLELDCQPTAYRMAARELGYGDAGITLLVVTKTRVPLVQIERLARHQRDEREFSETALTVLRATEAGVDHRVRGWACKGCPFASACST